LKILVAVGDGKGQVIEQEVEDWGVVGDPTRGEAYGNGSTMLDCEERGELNIS